MIVILVYWMLVIIGLLDIDLFDLDLDADADLDGGVDGDVGDVGGFSVLSFLNIGEAPVMFFVSIVTLGMWVISVRVNYWLQNDNIWIALALAVPNFAFCVLFTKFLLEPVKYYKRQQPRKSSIVGKTCVVKSLELTEKGGRCEVATESAPIIVNARTENGEVLRQGDAATVVKHLPDQGFHIVTKQS
jgi:hypothetical protein